MSRTLLLLFLALPALARAETRDMTLRQVLDLALRQNPDIAIARLDEQKAQQQVRIAKDPFVPRFVIGSGLAYSAGYPMSIDGSPPSIVQGKVIRTLYNRTQSFQLQEAKENYHAAMTDAASRRDDILYRIATLYMDTERMSRELSVARRQIESLERVSEGVRAQVAEGRVLEVEAKRANLRVAVAKQRVQSLSNESEYLESSLAMVLGFGQADKVRAVDEERQIADLGDLDEQNIVNTALDNNKELKKLQSSLLAKNLEVRAQNNARWPVFDLVAQYGMFSKYNYADWFRRFQRNNGTIGMSIQFPVWTGNAAAALAVQASLDAERIRKEIAVTRTRVALDARKAYNDYRNAESGREVARMDLEVARDDLSVALAKYEEGRVSVADLEKFRATENDKWIAYYEAQHTLRKARLNVLRQTGSLMAAVQ